MWLGVAVAGVLLRGPVWDENYEFAQVLLDKVVYPAGHPEHFHVKNLATVQLYLVALQVALGGGPEWVCGVRNVLFTLGKTLPFFFLGAFVTRRVLVGHAAALAALLLGGASFVNAYPATSWPVIPTNGMIGTSAALLCVILIACGRLKSGFAVAAAMPAIHIGQCPPVALFAGIVFLHALLYRREKLRPIVIGAALGAPVTLVSALLAWKFHVPYVPAPAFTGPVDQETVWRGFLQYVTWHQRLKIGPDLLCMIWTLWLLGACCWHLRKEPAFSVYAWLFLYAALLCVLVWSIMFIHAVLQDRTPHLLLFWIPYRLPNHLPPLVAAVTAMLLLRDPHFSMSILLLPAALYLSLKGSPQTDLLTGLSGALIPVLIAPRYSFGRTWGITSVAVWLLGLALLQMPILPFIYGLGAGLMATMLDARRRLRDVHKPIIHPAYWAAIGGLVLACSMRPTDGAPDLVVKRRFDEVFTRLESAGAVWPNEMLCVPHFQRVLQGRLNHPVIAEEATLTWIPYHRVLGPGIQRLYQDIYGIDITQAYEGHVGYTYLPLKNWDKVWTERSEAEWQALGRRYGFRYVISPIFVPLHLPQVLSQEALSLYKIPALTAAVSAQ